MNMTQLRPQDTSHLAEVFGRKATGVEEARVRELLDAARLGDIETVASSLRIKWTEAARMVAKYNEVLSRCSIREVLRTPDARHMMQALLKVLAQYPVTRVGREKALTMIPTLDKDIVQSRLSIVGKAIDLHETLEGKGSLERVLNALRAADFEEIQLARKAPIVVVFERSAQEELARKFGSEVRVEHVESEVKAKELLKTGEVLLAVGKTSPEPGMVRIEASPESWDVYPHVVTNFYLSRRKILRSLLAVAEEIRDSPLAKDLFKELNLEEVRAVVSLIGQVEPEKKAGAILEAMSEAEQSLNQQIRRRRIASTEQFKRALEETIFNLSQSLNLKVEEEELLKRAGLEEPKIPFEFSRLHTNALVRRYERRFAEEQYRKLRDIAMGLESHRDQVDAAVKALFELDLLLAVARFARDFQMTMPRISEGGGIGLRDAKNPFLLQDELKGGHSVEPVSYTIGRTSIELPGATPRNVVILTGANSGGKTTLLNTLAVTHILVTLGLPVPASEAEVPLLPMYLFRRRTTRKIGSLEQIVGRLGPTIADRKPKLLLIDEFEALTEPGAAGRIVASALNTLSTGSTLTLLVTHLSREILPHVRLRIRVDGIEAKGLDEKANLIVDRQPKFNHVGTSTPEFVIERLSRKAKNRRLKGVYEGMMASLKEKPVATQTPLALPWVEKAE